MAAQPAVAQQGKPGALPEPQSAEHIQKLVRQLGDNDYFVRQGAQDELARLGFQAFDAVNAATTMRTWR